MDCPVCGSQMSNNGHVYKNKQKTNIQKLICKDCGKTLQATKYSVEERNEPPIYITTDKKIGEVKWRNVLDIVEQVQEQHEKASWSQDRANVELKTDYDKIILQFLSDTHLGSIGTDYKIFREMSELVINTPNLFLVLAGDLTDNFVKFKNMLAMHQQILSPEQQDEFLEDWIKELAPKILFATWGNHEEMEEKHTGRNIIKRILKHNVIYMNGIGQANLKLNDVNYKIAVTHKTRYNSSFNITHGLKQLARKDIPDADIYVAGDTHNPAKETAFERGMEQIFIKLGTLKVNDGYSKRYFSYYTSSAMPCVVLNTKEKKVVDFWTLEDAMKFAEN